MEGLIILLIGLAFSFVAFQVLRKTLSTST